MADELITRSEAAHALDVSERQWDRIRKTWTFTEVHVTDGRKGLRFLSQEIQAYIEAKKCVKYSAAS